MGCTNDFVSFETECNYLQLFNKIVIPTPRGCVIFQSLTFYPIELKYQLKKLGYFLNERITIAGYYK